MNVKQRFKLGAGAGLVTMLLGALMVLAPGAGADEHEGPVAAPPTPTVVTGNPSCAFLGYDIEAKFDASGEPGQNGTATGTKTVGPDTYTLKVDWTWSDQDPKTISFAVVDPPSNVLVSAVIVKQGNGANVYTYTPPVESGDGLVDNRGDNQFSHISFCADIPSDTPLGALTVDKVVDDAARPQADELAFPFTVTCGEEDLGDDAAFNLTDAATAKDVTAIPAGTECTVTETDKKGADKTTVEATGKAAVEALSIKVVIVADATQTVTFTNTYNATTPRTGSLRVDKDLGGNNLPAASTQFTFTAACTSGQQAVSLGGDASFTLTAAQTKTISNLPVGASCTVTETGTANATSTTYKIGDGATTIGTQASGATIAADATTAVLFVNTYTITEQPPILTETPTLTYSVDVDKVNDADDDGLFGNFEFADAEGDDVEFRISIENTGTGVLTLATLTDTFDGEVVNLLTQVDLSCLRAGAPVTPAVGSGLPVGSTTVCTFTLDDYAPAAGTSLRNVVEVDTLETGPATDPSTVAVVAVLPDATGSVNLVKEVTGDEATAWDFDFTGALGDVSLTNALSETGMTGVPAGSHSIAEDISDLPDGWAFEGAACVDQDDEVVGEADADGSVDFVVAPNASVTCTFVNSYTAPEPEVEPTEVVLGDVVTRPATLPRTGDETGSLAGVGAFMLALGAAMVLGSKRQLARR